MTAVSSPRKQANSGLSVLRPQRAGVVYALVVVVVVFQALSLSKGLPGFLSVTNVRNIIDQSSLDGVLVAYVAADVFALLSSYEPWGVVVNEAAACGLPLVLSERVGAARRPRDQHDHPADHGQLRPVGRRHRRAGRRGRAHGREQPRHPPRHPDRPRYRARGRGAARSSR